MPTKQDPVEVVPLDSGTITTLSRRVGVLFLPCLGIIVIGTGMVTAALQGIAWPVLAIILIPVLILGFIANKVVAGVLQSKQAWLLAGERVQRDAIAAGVLGTKSVRATIDTTALAVDGLLTDLARQPEDPEAVEARKMAMKRLTEGRT